MASVARNLDSVGALKAFEAELQEANINPKTYLATDYLNHYNEITMLLEMLPDMPDMVEECLEWRPKTYKQHFEDSVFQAKSLAIEAYDLAPSASRDAFDSVCHDLDSMIDSVLGGLKAVNAAQRGLSDKAQELVRQRVNAIQEDLMQLNKVIHGTASDTDPQIEDHSAEMADTISGAEGETQTQADIDKLFD